jgi:hypothetical protein
LPMECCGDDKADERAGHGMRPPATQTS